MHTNWSWTNSVKYQKKLKMLEFGRLVLVLLGLSLQVTSGRGELPKITVGGWLDKDVQSQWNNTSPPPLDPPPYLNAISVPSIIQGLSLICNASYPIEWRFHQERWDWKIQLQFAVQTTRISNGLDVIGFSSELSVLSHENTVTGNYICQKVGFPDLSSSLYVFWEGISPPYLTLANLYRKPPQIPFKRESGSFTLPCTVSIPSVQPTLSKEGGQNQTEILIPLNRSVTYDPRYGFTLTNLKVPHGRYTCQVGDAEEEGDGDIITFNVIDADDTPQTEFNDTLNRRGAYYKIDSKKRELVCCSANDKAPKLKLIECDHPTICAVTKHSLHNMESQKKKNGSCSIIELFAKRAGVFRCVGAGIDVVREFFFPMPENPFRRWRGRGHNKDKNNGTVTTTPAPSKDDEPLEEPYYDWYEADRAKMMQVTELTSPLYVGETRNFSCKVSHFYYSKGIVWAISYTNETEEYLDGKTQTLSRRHDPHANSGRARHFRILFGRYQSVIEVSITENIDSIICYAPVWNSTEWGKKAINMEIHKPSRPKIIGRTKEEYTWFLNDTNKALVCKFDGEPMPNVTWTRNNKTFQHTTNNEVNGTSKLVFQTVSIETQATYECTMKNVAGTVVKKFRVSVIHSASSVLMVVSTIAVMGLVFVVVATIFLCRYLKSQKSIMQHLANLAFKDVTSNNSNNLQNDSRSPAQGNFATNTAIYTSSNGSVNHETSGNEGVSINDRNYSVQEQQFPDTTLNPIHSQRDANPVHVNPDAGGYHKL